MTRLRNQRVGDLGTTEQKEDEETKKEKHAIYRQNTCQDMLTTNCNTHTKAADFFNPLSEEKCAAINASARRLCTAFLRVIRKPVSVCWTPNNVEQRLPCYKRKKKVKLVCIVASPKVRVRYADETMHDPPDQTSLSTGLSRVSPPY